MVPPAVFFCPTRNQEPLEKLGKLENLDLEFLENLEHQVVRFEVIITVFLFSFAGKIEKREKKEAKKNEEEPSDNAKNVLRFPKKILIFAFLIITIKTPTAVMR